eukprot:m.159258 g.159258  ORF g.159258 m.159258 type:complete len:164 (-) comp9838_c0_seq4:1198-1689(-)
MASEQPPPYSATDAATIGAGLPSGASAPLGTPEDLSRAEEIVRARGHACRVLAALRVSEHAADYIAWGRHRKSYATVKSNPLCWIPPCLLYMLYETRTAKRRALVLQSVYRHMLYIVTETGIIQHVDRDAVIAEIPPYRLEPTVRYLQTSDSRINGAIIWPSG